MTNAAGVSVLKRALLATLKLHFFGVTLLIFYHLWPHFNTEKLSVELNSLKGKLQYIVGVLTETVNAENVALKNLVITDEERR